MTGVFAFLCWFSSIISLQIMLYLVRSSISDKFSIHRNHFTMAFASTVHAQSCSASTEKSTKLSIHENLYQPVPAHLKLEKVVVIHRHGDRTPIERGCGPNFPERKSMSGKWASTLPSLKTIERIERVGRIVYQSVSEKQFVEMTEAYSGWDQKEIPYGQLTELGAQQLIRLGEKMRHRYGGNVLPLNIEEAEKHVYCRSTFICRTVHSIRSFLVGLYNIDAAESEPTTPSSSNDEAKFTLTARKYHFPTIHTRPKLEETLYPQVDGRCSVILDRRVKIEPLRHLSFYDELSTKMRRIFGYTETNLPWINMQEVLTCHSTYNLLHHFPEVDVNDIDQISDILAGIWGILYRVSYYRGKRQSIFLLLTLLQEPEMARLGLGRFVSELMADIEEIPHDHHHQVKQKFNHPVDDIAPTKNKKFLVYSAHDSTLIPLLCMLRLFDGKASHDSHSIHLLII